MTKDYLKTLANFKRAAIFGIILGFSLFIAGIFVNASIGTYALSAAGIGVTIASMVVFGFGMCLSLMEELNQNNPRTYP